MELNHSIFSSKTELLLFPKINLSSIANFTQNFPFGNVIAIVSQENSEQKTDTRRCTEKQRRKYWATFSGWANLTTFYTTNFEMKLLSSWNHIDYFLREEEKMILWILHGKLGNRREPDFASGILLDSLKISIKTILVNLFVFLCNRGSLEGFSARNVEK